jgi:Ca-activated chloride channel homolog
MPKVAKTAFFFLVIAVYSFARGQAAPHDANVPAVATGATQAAPAEWPQVVLNVLVDAKKGATDPVNVSSLEILEDGTQQEIESTAGPGSPVSLCLAIDISGSMTSKREQIAAAAKELVKSLPLGSEVMVSVFADKAYLAEPFTPAEALDLSLFDRLKFGHRTAMSDAVVITEPYFVQFARYPRRALVIITGGYNNASTHGENEAVRAMEAPGSPFVYALGLVDPYAYAPNPEGRPALQFLDSAGAYIIPVPSIGEISKSAAHISQCIERQYALSYRSALAARDNRLHKVEVKLPQADKRIKVESLPGYYIPSH